MGLSLFFNCSFRFGTSLVLFQTGLRIESRSDHTIALCYIYHKIDRNSVCFGFNFLSEQYFQPNIFLSYPFTINKLGKYLIVFKHEYLAQGFS